MDFKKTRLMNWILATLILLGSLMLLFKSNSLLGTLAILSVFIIAFAIPSITAVSLSSESLVILGSTIFISESKRVIVRKVAWYLNLLFLIYLFFGIALFVFSGDYSQALPIFLISALPALNLIALRKLKKSNN
jgi:hypothetical protein